MTGFSFQQVSVQTEVQKKCKGITLEKNLFQCFPLNALSDSVIVENFAFHSVECKVNHYMLFSDEQQDINSQCQKIESRPDFQRLVMNMNDNEIYKSNNNHNQLSHEQMAKRAYLRSFVQPTVKNQV